MPPIAKFNTLERERTFQNPSNKSFQTPALQEMVAPHIEAFNALMEFGVGKKTGLLDLALQDIGSKAVFDMHGDGLGNKLSCTSLQHSVFTISCSTTNTSIVDLPIETLTESLPPFLCLFTFDSLGGRDHSEQAYVI
jgi:hypothetical protein